MTEIPKHTQDVIESVIFHLDKAIIYLIKDTSIADYNTIKETLNEKDLYVSDIVNIKMGLKELLEENNERA